MFKNKSKKTYNLSGFKVFNTKKKGNYEEKFFVKC
jgi:hypothetical protein